MERLPWFQRERTLLAANARSGSDGSMSRETIEIDQAGPAKTCRLSRQVSGACDVWLKKRGLAIGREASTQMFRGQWKKKVALAEAQKAPPAEKTNQELSRRGSHRVGTRGSEPGGRKLPPSFNTDGQEIATDGPKTDQQKAEQRESESAQTRG